MSWRDFILNRFWLKLFSLAMASLLWFAIQSNQYAERPSETRDFRRPVAIPTSASKRRVFKLEPNEVDVRVGGRPELLKKLHPEDIHVHVKFTDAPNPQGSFPVEVSVPREVTLQWVWPSHVHVEPVSQD